MIITTKEIHIEAENGTLIIKAGAVGVVDNTDLDDSGAIGVRFEEIEDIILIGVEDFLETFEYIELEEEEDCVYLVIEIAM